MENKEKFLIIDGNSIMNRTFYAIKLLTTKDGLYTNALYGFLNIYYMMQEKIKPDYVAVTFDLSAPTFRHKLYDKYKEGRRSMPDELRVQMPIIKNILKAMNVTIIEQEGFEADDILGTVSKNNEEKDIVTYILTGDKDAFQLISKTSYVVIPSSKMGKTEYTIFTPELLKEKYNIYPNQVVDVKALMGDASDNIPGIYGIGTKTAHSIIEKYNDLDYIYKHIDNIDIKPLIKEKLKNNKDVAILSKELATINTNVPIMLNYNSLKITNANEEELYKLFTRLQFKKFLEKLNNNEEYEHNILKDFDENIFEEITNITTLKEVLIDKIFFCYFDDNINSESLKNNIYILKNNKILYFKINNNELLKVFSKRKCIKIGFNIKKLLKIIIDGKNRDIKGFEDDLQIAYYLLNPNEGNYSIENIAYNILDINIPELNNTQTTVQTSIFDTQIDTETDKINIKEKEYVYCYLHCIYKCYDRLVEQLNENNLYPLYKEIEIPLIQTLADMESVGMHMDKQALSEFGDFLNQQLTELTKEIYTLSNETFNINSPQQLGVVLYEKMGLPCYKKTKENYSTDKETLQEIASKHPIINKVLKYRELAKLKSTYVDGLINLLDDKDKIHTTFMQTVTATGRLSSIEPNLQNIPVRTELGGMIRKCFTTINDNNLIDADYSQIELRILSHIAQDEKMIYSFLNNEDIHTATASKVFNIPIEKVTKEQRFQAKAVNFGIVYGISDYGLSKNINSTREQAKEYIESYLKQYSNIDKYMKDIIILAKEQGYVSTLYGRRRNIPELKSSNHNTIMFGKRIAMNMPIQGTAADIMKKAMNNVYYKMLEENLTSRLVMQVHDELIIESPVSETNRVKEILLDCMKNVIKLKVPLEVDINVGKNWYEAK